MAVGQERPLVDPVGEGAHASDLLGGVVTDRRARAHQALRAGGQIAAGPEPHERPLGAGHVGGRGQLEATQAAGRGLRRREVDRAVRRHLPSERRPHCDFVGATRPEIADLASRRNRQESAMAGAQHVLADEGIGVQPEFRPAQCAEAHVEHLQRQAVAGGFFVLPHVAAALQDCQQPMRARNRQVQRARHVGDAQTAGRPAEDLAHVESLVGRRRGLGWAHLLLSFQYTETDFTLAKIQCIRGSDWRSRRWPPI